MQCKLSRLCRASLGLKSTVQKAIYSAIAEKIVLYVAPIWYNDQWVIKDCLLSIQRDLLLIVTKCYGTTPTDALTILLGVLPLDLHASLERDYATLTQKRRNIEGTDFSPDMAI